MNSAIGIINIPAITWGAEARKVAGFNAEKKYLLMASCQLS
jgi:hypothetical protein